MKSRIKGILALLFTALLTVLLVACGDTGNEPEEGTGNNGGTTETDSSKQTVKIGVMTPISGPGARTGEYYEAAIETAYKHIQEDDFLEHYNLEFEFVDDKRDTAEAVTAANYVIDQYGADVTIGHVWTTMVLATGQFFEDAQIPNIGIVSGPASVAQGWDYQFIATGTDHILADTLLNYLINERGYENIALLNINTEGGTSAANRIVEILDSEYGLELAAHEIHGENDTDFTAQVLTMADSNADVTIFWGGTQSQASIFHNQIEQLWGDVPGEILFTGDSKLAQAQMLENFNLEDMEGMVFPTGFIASNEDDQTVRFVEDFKEIDTENQVPGDVPARVYDAVYFIANALNNLGEYDVNSDDFSVKLRDAMASTSFEGVQGYFDYSAFNNGEGLSAMNIAEWNNDGTYDKVWEPTN